MKKIYSLIAIVAVLATFTACNKQRSELATRKATENVKQAIEWKAAEFPESKSALESAQNSLKAAEQSAASKQYKPALTQAQDAVKQSQEALKAAKTRFADQQRQNAAKAVQIATANDGQNENAELFSDAQEKLQEANEKYGKQKYEDTIALSTQVIDNVEQLLARLKNASTNRLADLESRLKELEKANAQELNANALIRAKDAIEAIRKKIDTDRDYKQAIILAGTAINEADAGIIETKRRDATNQLQELEAKIAEAIAEEAPIHTPDQLKIVQESFEQILRDFYENQYDTVLGAAKDLQPRVDQLIVMTRIEATKDKIRTVTEAINRLKDQAVEQYLPGRIQVMEDLLRQSQDLFNNNDYDGAKFQASNALIERDRIEASFDAMTENAIQNANGAVDVATKTFDRMREIFSTDRSRTVDPQLSQQREVQATQLEARAADARQTVELASQNRTQKEYKKAIEQAKDANATAELVTDGTYRIVAQHTLVGIQDETSELERQGARDQAPRQINQVQNLVEQTQKLISENQNRQAVDLAAKTRAYLENIKQELARRAVEERNNTDSMIQRLEGGAAPTPASGGENMRAIQRSLPFGLYPGGASENNKEGMFDLADAEALQTEEPIILAQLTGGPQQISTGYSGGNPPLDNRNIPAGTFMTNQAPSVPYGLAPEPGAPTGAIIGTRPEPIVPTRDEAGSGSSMGSYEAPTSPGPFVAASALEGDVSFDAEVGSPRTSALQSIRDEIDEILMNDTRVLDIQTYQPRAVERARALLDESSQALQAQNYVRAVDLAREAQRVIFEAERKAARQASEKNIQDAADRINLAQASSAIMFAPAQITEAIGLYNQAELAYRRGDYLVARDTSARAVIAADDARLYNVNKARDLSALSTRYGGWKSSHPILTDSLQRSAIAEGLLSDPATAAQGQAIAQEAVVAAQLALDHSRDYTFQERIDNIYKALNTSLRAGANYFNVTEVKKLIAEISVARDEYCTRNFDAVELKLKDIEARLARVIETTPLVLEQNLIETTEKLNALVLAGAEEWMAQEVDDVKSLMNRSAIDFRKHDYYSSYVNIRNAQKLTDKIEERLQEQVYFDAVTELFAQLDKAFYNFEKVVNQDRAFMKKLISTQQGQPKYVEFTGRMSPNDFKDNITDIYLRAIHLKPPQSQEGTHNQVLLAIKFAKVAAENFQKLLILDQVSMPDAYDIIDTAYNQVERSQKLRSEVQVRLIEPQARTHVIRAEKIVNF